LRTHAGSLLGGLVSGTPGMASSRFSTREGVPVSAMDDVRTAFVGTIPERYNAMLGPLLTDPVAAITAARVAGHAPTEVLETASGTGILTRRLTAALPGSTRLVASDLNESMLAVARSALTEAAN